MARRSIHAVLFDAAGTLIHPREPVGVTYARIAADHNVIVAAEQIENAFRSVFRSMPAMVFPGASPQETMIRERQWWSELVRRVFAAVDPTVRFAHFDIFFDALFRHFAAPAAWASAEQAQGTLTALRNRTIKTGVVSNFDHRLPAILAGLGLAPLLDVVVRPADVGAAKPDALIFLAALRTIGVAAEDAVYVGDDDDEDVGGARLAGLWAVNVATLPSLNVLVERIEDGAAL